MNNEIMNISGIDCYEKDGTAYLKLETVARGLGFTDTSKDTEYVRWNTVRKYLGEIGFSQEVAKDAFIPENIFYRLAMKAKNEAAEKFQAKIADEVIPAIRKHGAYMTPETIEKVLLNPDTIIKLATSLKEEQEKCRVLELENTKQKLEIAEMKPKVNYYEVVLQCKDLVPITVIAKDYGWSAIRMNQYLNNKKVQFKRNGTWVLYQKYADKGYTGTQTYTYDDRFGNSHADIRTLWTQNGRLFIYEMLKKDNVLPLIEQAKCEAGDIV